MDRQNKDTLRPNDPQTLKKEFEKFSIEVFSQGKVPQRNEDAYFVSENTFCVIDGVTPKAQLEFVGKSGGEFASDLIANFLTTSPPNLTGEDLIDALTAHFQESFKGQGLLAAIEQDPRARPGAVLVCARIIDGKLIVTQVDDVGFRINGQQTYRSKDEVDVVTAAKRVRALEEAKAQNPALSDEELANIGRTAILPDLERQTIEIQNSPDHPLGYGAIDGRKVPRKFIKVFTFDLADVKTIEIFSDGYFKLAEKPTIESWEQAFAEVEELDPLKIGEYPSTKGSVGGQFTDDRTILIARFKNVRYS